jgi:hypothetical protein
MGLPGAGKACHGNSRLLNSRTTASLYDRMGDTWVIEVNRKYEGRATRSVLESRHNCELPRRYALSEVGEQMVNVACRRCLSLLFVRVR